jgi:hypothetical protein
MEGLGVLEIRVSGAEVDCAAVADSNVCFFFAAFFHCCLPLVTGTIAAFLLWWCVRGHFRGKGEHFDFQFGGQGGLIFDGRVHLLYKIFDPFDKVVPAVVFAAYKCDDV